MSVELKKVEVEVTKESFEVFEALEHLVGEILSKKPLAEIAASSLPKLMVAVDGAQKISDEVKHEAFYETAALGGAKIAKAILKSKKEE